MSPALCERRGGAQLDGLGLVKDHRGQRLLPQRQHVQLGLQHGLEVLVGIREKHTPGLRKACNQGSATKRFFVNVGCVFCNICQYMRRKCCCGFNYRITKAIRVLCVQLLFDL